MRPGLAAAICAAMWAGTCGAGEDLEALVDATNKTRRALAVDAMQTLPKGEKVTDLSAMIEELDACEIPKRSAGGLWTADKDEAVSAGALEAALDGAEAPLDAVALARALQREGLYARAAELYQKALEEVKEDAGQRAWLLLMLGDCQMRTDAEAASATYKRLTAEHIDSPWRAFAMFRSKLLTWQLSDPVVGELAQKEKK